jgi:hypothetical protein
LADPLVKPDDPLPALDDAFDDPEYGATCDDLGLAFGPHAGDVLRVAIARLGLWRGLPSRKACHIVGADRKFEEMDRGHDFSLLYRVT